jgi:hypothetical protein
MPDDSEESGELGPQATRGAREMMQKLLIRQVS